MKKPILTLLAWAVTSPLLLALTWVDGPSPGGDADQRVRYSRAVAGHLVIECYAFEPYEDRMYYDISAVGLLGATVKIVNMRGVWTTPERCQYEGHLDAHTRAKKTSDATGNPPPKCPAGQRC